MSRGLTLAASVSPHGHRSPDCANPRRRRNSITGDGYWMIKRTQCSATSGDHCRKAIDMNEHVSLSVTVATMLESHLRIPGSISILKARRYSIGPDLG